MAEVFQGKALFAFDPVKHRDRAFEASRKALAGDAGHNNHGPIGVFMVEAFGKAAVPELVKYFEGDDRLLLWSKQMMDSAARLGTEATPVFLSALNGAHSSVHQ